ncbi:MAG TPA: ferredoxin [Acidimicrobiales bacterium]|nr:ferredoxin [Acidimicrobiales bacterium]
MRVREPELDSEPELNGDRRPRGASSGVELSLTFDASRCDGYGMCAVVFPERISLDNWGYADVDPAPLTDPAGLRRAERAVRCCPRRALGLTERVARGKSE